VKALVPIALSAETLGACSERVAVPAYDRRQVTVGIVHFGVGGFHRAHQAMYLDRLMNAGTAFDWGICGVGVMEVDRGMKHALEAQDCLYTLVQKHGNGEYEARVIGSIVEYLFAPDDPEAVIARLADPAIRIVSLTITEGGYSLDDATGEFNSDTPQVARDIKPGATPRSVFGLICAGLAHRRAQGLKPFAVMSCDNLQGNGDLARKAFTEFARIVDCELGDWVEREVDFPTSMVDRITPSTTDDDRADLSSRFGIVDRWPVVCEPFTQWVLEDSFSSGRPPLEEAGVQIVDDVGPYELMKLRLLNASHQGLCYFGRLCDYTFVHEAADDPVFRQFLRGYMDDEATPTLLPVPGVDLDAYKSTLLERFSNPEIRDTIARLCAESSDRIPKWLLPVIRQQIAGRGAIGHSAAIVASWARYAEGIDEHGMQIEIVDRRRDYVMGLAAAQRDDPLAFIESRDLFGDLARNERFRSGYLAALRSLHERGARQTLAALVGGVL
jgi:mannitol 2-dehydrogenase